MKKIAAFLLCLALIVSLSLTIQGSQPQKPAYIWQYKSVMASELLGLDSLTDAVEKLSYVWIRRNEEEAKKLNKVLEQNLNLLGRDGWELVCVKECHIYIFKRKLPSE